MQPHLIVFTDLDGTLLDHHSYSWRAASPAMAKLAANGIPLIFNSSKTAAEMRHLQNAMGIRAPFIVEPLCVCRDLRNIRGIGRPIGIIGDNRPGWWSWDGRRIHHVVQS